MSKTDRHRRNLDIYSNILLKAARLANLIRINGGMIFGSIDAHSLYKREHIDKRKIKKGGKTKENIHREKPGDRVESHTILKLKSRK